MAKNKFEEVFNEAFHALDGFLYWAWFNKIALHALLKSTDEELELYQEWIYDIKNRPELIEN